MQLKGLVPTTRIHLSPNRPPSCVPVRPGSERFSLLACLPSIALTVLSGAPKGPARAARISLPLVQFYGCTQFELLRFGIEETVYSSIVSYGG